MIAAAVIAALRECGVTHVVALPDNAMAPLLAALEHDDAIRSVPVTREGEAFAVASGLWIGGRSPVVIIQNTGLLESGDALRGTAQRMGVPLPVLVMYRGHAKMLAAGLNGADAPGDRETVIRPDVDSAALFTEPTLRAWSVPYTVAGEDIGASVRATIRRAHREERPVALLVP
jgi:phosphonopyruvate decarboxylase